MKSSFQQRISARGLRERNEDACRVPEVSKLRDKSTEKSDFTTHKILLLTAKGLQLQKNMLAMALEPDLFVRLGQVFSFFEAAQKKRTHAASLTRNLREECSFCFLADLRHGRPQEVLDQSSL